GLSRAASAVALASRVRPGTRQVCVDADPTCDFDPPRGPCALLLWFCLGGDEARLGCTADSVSGLDVIRPTPNDTGFPATALTAIDAALARLAFPIGPGEICSRRIDLGLPAGKAKLLIKSQATSVDGSRDRDSLKLVCAPAGTVLRSR